jgi:hypothetical protein
VSPQRKIALEKGDFVVFFCASKRLSSAAWDYFYVGVGVVGDTVDRKELWLSEEFAPYRRFYNTLAVYQRGGFVQQEIFHPFHKDWVRRLAPYIVFDPDHSWFNLSTPLHVATYKTSYPEEWHLECPRVAKLEDLLFRQHRIIRRLRTSHSGFSHPHINLGRRVSPSARDAALEQLRRELVSLVDYQPS